MQPIYNIYVGLGWWQAPQAANAVPGAEAHAHAHAHSWRRRRGRRPAAKPSAFPVVQNPQGPTGPAGVFYVERGEVLEVQGGAGFPHSRLVEPDKTQLFKTLPAPPGARKQCSTWNGEAGVVCWCGRSRVSAFAACGARQNPVFKTLPAPPGKVLEVQGGAGGAGGSVGVAPVWRKTRGAKNA